MAGKKEEAAKSGRTRKSHISVRVPPRLEEFLREKGDEHPRKLTGLIEDYLTFAAIANGYNPEAGSPMFDRLADALAGIMIERLENKGVIPKGGAEAGD